MHSDGASKLTLETVLIRNSNKFQGTDVPASSYKTSDTIRTIRQWDDCSCPFIKPDDQTGKENQSPLRNIWTSLSRSLPSAIPSPWANVQISFKIEAVRDPLLLAIVAPIYSRRLCFVYFSVIFVGWKFMCLRTREAERWWGISAGLGSIPARNISGIEIAENKLYSLLFWSHNIQ